MDSLIEISKKAAEIIRSSDSLIHVISHYDADGISSAAIMSAALLELNKDFQLTIVKSIKPELIEEIKNRNPELVIFLDIGSGHLNEISKLNCRVIIADHHEIEDKKEFSNIMHINPEVFKLENISGSYITYLLAKNLVDFEKIAPLAIVGAIGDSTFNHIDKLENKYVKLEKGLNLFGRYSRPVHKALEYSSDPPIPNVSGSESAAIQFLSEIGIESKKDGKWRTLGDLSRDELRKLNSAVLKELMKNDLATDDLFGNVWTLKGYPDELQDAKEFATTMNCCGRMSDPGTGVGVCLGFDKSIKKARGLMKGYRKLISQYMKWIEETPSSMLHTPHISYIVAKNNIHENMIGTIVSIYSKTNNSKKIILGLADSEDGVKVSARSLNGININTVIKEASEKVGGTSGGHVQAAGAVLPKGKEDEFIKACNDILERQKGL